MEYPASRMEWVMERSRMWLLDAVGEDNLSSIVI